MRFFLSKRYLGVIAGFLWTELSLLPIVTIGSIRPDFFLVFLVFYAFRIDYRSVVELAFFLGLLRDLFTTTSFGLETASFVLGGVFLRSIAIQFDREKRWIQLASLFMCSWLTLVTFSVLALLIQSHYGLNSWGLANAFYTACYTTLAGALILPLFDKWFGLMLRQKQYELF